MWSRSYSRTVKGLKAAQVWQVWADVNQWHTWQDDVEYATLDGDFESGKVFRFKPIGGPKIDIELTEVKPNSVFVDVTRFPLANMYDSHELIDRGDELEIRTTVSMDGALSLVWRKLVAENVARGMEEQVERLIEKARRA
ncbi:MAG TPA: SRPBCC family protein [Thermoanaerobaculia bacterium]|nr:SRPBCC family protein [Thermoanaerobaculia bacterium]